ncbi:MAG: hypothetical protein K0S07_1489 [Chlamydiales bacterium]|jgi:hydroxymethylpyrimidine pyrophosphatase-like HAD family hydrolase|nr:hypothetical protein [Chlamydiales bacterium]
MRGLIALDIDGTLTSGLSGVPSGVLAYLEQLFKDGWRFFFITGRTFRWSYESLKEISFPYDLGLQNGAYIVSMPSREVLLERSLERSIVAGLIKNYPSLAIYSGLMSTCYYSGACPPFLKSRAEKEEWIFQPLESMALDQFSALKYFGAQEELLPIQQQSSLLDVYAPIAKDPYRPGFFVLQVTHAEANKGSALKNMCKLKGFQHGSLPVIAAGDDENDLPLLRNATLKIAIKSAPQALLDMADLIAGPPEQMGLIDALSQAIANLKS